MTKLILSNSQTEMWQHSPRCFWWRYIRGLTLGGDTPNQNLAWGSAAHRGFEFLFSGSTPDSAIQLMRDEGSLRELEVLEEVGDFHTPEALRTFLDSYASNHLDPLLERFEVLDIESSLQHDLSTQLAWLGRADLVLRERTTGEIFLIDHKTTSKKTSSSYYSDRFLHDQQMTSYWWLATQEFGDDFSGILINACQTTKTIPFRQATIVLTRDQWQIDEWLRNTHSIGPHIREAKEVGPKLLDAGLREDDPEVLSWFPIHACYDENFCDYRFLNRANPDLREKLISLEYTTRTERGGEY